MRKTALRITLAVISLALISGSLWAGDDSPTATMSFVVVKDYNGRPVRNAAVVLHSVSEKGKQESGGVELKTDEQGKASYDGVPYGKVRVQVLARGLQTFGQDYDINQPTVELTIKLKLPDGEYSIYQNQQEQKPGPPPKPQ